MATVEVRNPLSTVPATDELLGRLGVGLLGAYLVILPIVLLWLLIAVFPPATPTATETTPPTTAPSASTTEQRTGTATQTQRSEKPTPKFGVVTILRSPWLLTIGPLTDDQGFILLAILAGALGSYLHVAQSFTAYVGNRQAKRSWVWWYVLRAPIGASLGILFYFVVRAGLMSGVADAVSPYGVVAFGALAGMFSKQATDKLAEVFDTLFRSQKDREYKDKLAPSLTLSSIAPSPVPPGTDVVVLTITGTGFVRGAVLKMDTVSLQTEYIGPTELRATVKAEDRPKAGTECSMTVVNPDPTSAPSALVRLQFE